MAYEKVCQTRVAVNFTRTTFSLPCPLLFTVSTINSIPDFYTIYKDGYLRHAMPPQP